MTPGPVRARLTDAVVRGLRRLSRKRKPVMTALAVLRRRRLDGVVFVGVTGSVAKTTTKNLTAAVLATRAPVRTSRATENRVYSAVGTVLGVRRGTWAVVQEVAASRPGSLDPVLRVLRPQVGVVTHVALDHFRAFRTSEAVAAEKGKLVEALPEDGVAVLNADDPLVAAMARRTRARVVTFGLSPQSEVRGEEVAAAWPDRLSLTVHAGRDAVRVRTRLVGRHWAHSVLAAVAVGHALGVRLYEAAAAVSQVEPHRARLSPLELPDGVTFLRDDWKASLGSVDPVLELLREARAQRKVLVVGTLSDYGGSARKKYRDVARRALEVADEVIFVGPWAGRVASVAASAPPGALRSFPTVLAATEYLQATLRAGDLVLLKGSSQADHLARIALARQGRVACWRTRCGRRQLCDGCRLRVVPAPPA